MVNPYQQEIDTLDALWHQLSAVADTLEKKNLRDTEDACNELDMSIEHLRNALDYLDPTCASAQ